MQCAPGTCSALPDARSHSSAGDIDISEHETLDVATVSRNDCCMLGKWLHGSGRPVFGHQPIFGNLTAKRAHFLREAGRVAHVINSGQYDEALAMTQQGTPFADASGAVGMAIRGLKKVAGL